MKTIKHEVKLEKSVKVILGAFAFGIILNAFVTPAGQELFGIKDANAAGPVHKIAICDAYRDMCASVLKSSTSGAGDGRYIFGISEEIEIENR